MATACKFVGIEGGDVGEVKPHHIEEALKKTLNIQSKFGEKHQLAENVYALKSNVSGIPASWSSVLFVL